jgi:ubiquinone biosynthesis protein
VFDMETRPELILLQKSMVIVEGVARGLDPDLNLWVAAEPVAKAWMEKNLGPMGRLRDAGAGAGEVAKILADLPQLMQSAERATIALGEMSTAGVRLSDATVSELGRRNHRSAWWQTGALWIGALSLLALAVKQFAL